MPNYIVDRIRASAMAGAIGDGLGAPVEILSLDKIIERHGPDGVTQFHDYDLGDYLKWAPCEQTGKGVITDDTCMTMATLAGFTAAHQNGSDPITSIHQAYLRWGKKQAWAEGDYDRDGMIDHKVTFPSWLDSFCFSSGAGKGTIAALNSGRIGTLKEPMLIVDKKGEPFASVGCGGMMRVAPVGWMASLGRLPRHAFTVGRQVAAITHGSDIAQDTSGAVAVLIAELTSGRSWHGAFYSMIRALQVLNHNHPDHDNPALLFALAIERYHRRLPPANDPYRLRTDNPFREISAIPREMLQDRDERIDFSARVELGMDLKPLVKKVRLFNSDAVFIQVMAICTAAQSWHGTPAERLQWALTLAVTQDGDSDSVGAIVGNILGAQLGLEAVETMWNGDFRPQSAIAIKAALETINQVNRV